MPRQGDASGAGSYRRRTGTVGLVERPRFVMADRRLAAVSALAVHCFCNPADNYRLEAIPADAPTVETRTLLIRWGHLHLVRAALGCASMLVMLLVLSGSG
jgi:hypothetical protein